MPTLDACAWLGTFALTKDNSQKMVKDTGELTKMVDANAPQGKLDVQPCREFCAKNLKL